MLTITDTHESLTRQLEADGFTVGRPPHVSPDSVAIDRQAAAENTCTDCAHVGLDFLPFRRVDGQPGYRCIAWCSCCESAVEF